MNFETSHDVLTVHSEENIWILPNKSSYGAENECGIFNEDLTPHLASRIYRQTHPCQQISYQNSFPCAHSNSLNGYTEIESCIFLGSLPDHYGHFVTEGLARLWYFLENHGCTGPFFYCAPEKFKYHNFIKDVFEGRVNCISEPIRVKRCYVPEPSIILQNYVNQKYWDTVEYVNKTCDTLHKYSYFPEKVYLSKLDVKNGRNIGEKLLIRYFKNKNIEIVDPTKYELGEFVAKLRTSSEIFASSGSQAHNAIFLDPRQILVELERSDHIHPFQEYIDHNRGNKRTQLRGYVERSSGDFSAGPFALYPTEEVRQHFLDKRVHFQKIWFRLHFAVVSRVSAIRLVFYKLWQRYRAR